MAEIRSSKESRSFELALHSQHTDKVMLLPHTRARNHGITPPVVFRVMCTSEG